MAEEKAAAVQEKKVNVEMAVIAYILFLIPLLTDAKDDPFVKFHLKQAMLLVILTIITSVVSTAIPVIGWFFIWPIASIFFLVLWIIGIVNAVNKEKKELPVIGKYAEQWLKF